MTSRPCQTTPRGLIRKRHSFRQRCLGTKLCPRATVQSWALQENSAIAASLPSSQVRLLVAAMKVIMSSCECVQQGLLSARALRYSESSPVHKWMKFNRESSGMRRDSPPVHKWMRFNSESSRMTHHTRHPSTAACSGLARSSQRPLQCRQCKHGDKLSLVPLGNECLPDRVHLSKQEAYSRGIAKTLLKKDRPAYAPAE